MCWGGCDVVVCWSMWLLCGWWIGWWVVGRLVCGVWVDGVLWSGGVE